MTLWGSKISSYGVPAPSISCTRSATALTCPAAWLLWIRRCGFCKRIAPVYEKVATAVKEDPNTNVIVAKIDGSSNRLTFKRFEGTHFPTIVFVHNGRYLKYNGQRTEEDLLKFVQGGWREAEEEEWTAVPEPMTLIGGILDTIASEFITLIDDLRKLSTTKLPVVTAVFSAGVLVGVVLTFLAVTCLPGGSKANKLRSKRKDADKPKAD